LKRKLNGPARYAIYLRCSTDDQTKGDYSTIEAQRDVTSRHIAEQTGVLAGQFMDEGRTGTNLNRPGWRRLLAAARAGEFDVVVCTYMSRLGRGNMSAIAEHMLQEAGVHVQYVKETFRGGDAADVADYINKEATRFGDGLYAASVRKWTITKMEENFRQGYFVGGRIPFGHKTVPSSDTSALKEGDKQPPKRLVSDPETAPVVRHAFELYAATKSVNEVLDYLRRMTDRNWNYTKVVYLLQNTVYRGVARWRGMVNEKANEPLINEGLWEVVQASLTRKAEAHARRPKSNPVDAFPYYLRGMVYCPHCGYRMTPSNHHGRIAPVRYYQCIGSGKFGAKDCPCPRVNARSLHEAVLHEISRVAQHPTRTAEIIREAVKALPTDARLQEQLTVLTRRLRETQKRLKNVTDSIETGGRAVVTLVRRLEELEAEQTALQQERTRLEQAFAVSKIQRPSADAVRAVYARFTQLWEAATEAERAELLPLLVEQVEMKDKERGIVRLVLETDFSALNFATARGDCGFTSNLREDNGN